MFGSVIVIHAEEEKQSVDEIKKIMAEAALNWAETFQPETKYQIGEVIPIYNGNDVIASYYVSYLKNSSPNGYIVLTVQDEALEVLEFSFESKTDLYQQLKGSILLHFGMLLNRCRFCDPGRIVKHVIEQDCSCRCSYYIVCLYDGTWLILEFESILNV